MEEGYQWMELIQLTCQYLEKSEKIDKNLLRYLTVKVKKLDLDTDYFKKTVDNVEK